MRLSYLSLETSLTQLNRTEKASSRINQGNLFGAHQQKRVVEAISKGKEIYKVARIFGWETPDLLQHIPLTAFTRIIEPDARSL